MNLAKTFRNIYFAKYLRTAASVIRKQIFGIVKFQVAFAFVFVSAKADKNVFV